MAVLAKLGSLFRSASRRSLSRSCSSSSSNSSRSSCGRSCGYDSHDDDDAGLSVPADVPKGCMAVIVGSCETRRRRFVVETDLLRNPVFVVLLQRAADEYGYKSSGALEIPCDPVLFEHFLWLLNNGDPAAAMLEVDDLMAFYS